MELYTASLLQGSELAAWQQTDFILTCRSLRGLIVEEYQKSRRMLVADRPRRAQLLCEKLFEVDKPSTTFEYPDAVDEKLVLQLMATVRSIL